MWLRNSAGDSDSEDRCLIRFKYIDCKLPSRLHHICTREGVESISRGQPRFARLQGAELKEACSSGAELRKARLPGAELDSGPLSLSLRLPRTTRSSQTSYSGPWVLAFFNHPSPEP